MKHPLMRVFTAGIGLTVVGILGAAGLVNAQTKEVRGAVTAISNSSMTISAGQHDMTFIIDPATKVEVKAAAKKSRAAGSAGNPGVTVTEFIKTGNNVLVRYKEDGAGLHALSIRPVSSAPKSSREPSDEDIKVANGTVKQVTQSHLTLESRGEDLTFAVNAETDVLARNASKTTKAVGGKTTIADFVHDGDTVSITYLDRGGAMTASQVRVRLPRR